MKGMMQFYKSKSFRIGVIILTVFALSLYTMEAIWGVKVKASPSIMSVSLSSNPSMPAESELTNGLWYQDINNPIFVGGYQVSFMKIYSIGGTSRVMELSTYPRAYKDTDPHVYTEDTPFTVTEEDLNYYDENDERWYQDILGNLTPLGGTALHYAGEGLPGAFPLWLESETLPVPSWVDRKNSVFPMVYQAIKGELVTVTIHEIQYKDVTTANPVWQPLPENLLTQFQSVFTDATNEIRVTKLIKNKDKFILRVLYDRVIR